ncbi:NHL repeat-containing protein 2 [Leptinotarsa decemlineata]|uniref:NHL repeat-containing protein 2 n=1 Tax=Leptinotarsa decemlineata TaxID=7539 RepID=UPI003D30C143
MSLFSKVIQNIRNSFSRTSSMQSVEDYLYYSQVKLQNFIEQRLDKDLGMQDYLKNVKYAPVEDFNPGLEWFNVTEPLSFKKHLKGKVVVLDFFTYCCINCMHIIPDLREIEKEFSVEDGLVVVGVHSAKFENEKISSNILAAVQRYNINHPVVNDANSEMWKNCDVQCWPTLLILGPNSNPIVMFTGEGHKDDLRVCIRNALKFYKENNLISNHQLPLKSAYHFLPELKGPLLFPGKITNFLDENNHELLAVSDTGNNRILILKDDGSILQQIGGRKLGFRDGNLEEAEFNNPQGLVFLNKDILFVADTENHAIRRIDLKKLKVDTVAGTGVQGQDLHGGKLWTSQAISSPWDLCIYRTPDMDLTFHPDGNPPVRNVLIIAMAGTHQIWALFLEDTVWWKCKKYPAGTCINIAGSGKEENRNNSYPHAAGFAQPSGLAICHTTKEVYIADSESSSVRRLHLIDGKVTPVVGGARNPNDLFAFGDKDGALFDAKLQHVLGLAISRNERILFVADTYNHKLKKVDVAENMVTSITIPSVDIKGGSSTGLREPAGLCVSYDNKKLYLADTNNHSIKVLYLDSNQNVNKIETMTLRKACDKVTALDKSKYDIIIRNPLQVSCEGGKLIVSMDLVFENGLGLTEGAPQTWLVDLPDITWSAVPLNGTDLKNIDLVISVPVSEHAKENNVDFIFNLVTCTSETCLPKSFIVRLPIHYQNEKKMSVNEKLTVAISPDKMKIL